MAPVPLYEFECATCGERFEALVGAGTETGECRACGVSGARRVLSAPAAPMTLAKSGGALRKQERANEKLRRRARKARGNG